MIAAGVCPIRENLAFRRESDVSPAQKRGFPAGIRGQSDVLPAQKRGLSIETTVKTSFIRGEFRWMSSPGNRGCRFASFT